MAKKNRTKAAVSVLKTVQEALENPATNMTVEEEDLVLPYVFEKYRIKYMQRPNIFIAYS